MRITDIALIVAAVGALVAAVEARNRVELTSPPPVIEPTKKAELITCPMRKPDFTTIMHAAVLGDGTLIVEQQTNTRVHHIKDC
jgi:hypothetical protein